MLKLYVWLKDLLRSERGQDLVEYALITAVLSLGIIAVIVLAGIPAVFGDWATGVKDCITNPSTC